MDFWSLTKKSIFSYISLLLKQIEIPNLVCLYIYVSSIHTLAKTLIISFFPVTMATYFIKIWLLSNNDFAFSLHTAALLHPRQAAIAKIIGGPCFTICVKIGMIGWKLWFPWQPEYGYTVSILGISSVNAEYRMSLLTRKVHLIARFQLITYNNEEIRQYLILYII